MKKYLILILLIPFLANATPPEVCISGLYEEVPGGGEAEVTLVGDDTSHTGGTDYLCQSGRAWSFGVDNSYEAETGGNVYKAYVMFSAVDPDDWRVCAWDADDENALLGCSDIVSGTTVGLNEATFSINFFIAQGDNVKLTLLNENYVSIQTASGSVTYQYSSMNYTTPGSFWTYSASSTVTHGDVTIYLTTIQ